MSEWFSWPIPDLNTPSSSLKFSEKSFLKKISFRLCVTRRIELNMSDMTFAWALLLPRNELSSFTLIAPCVVADWAKVGEVRMTLFLRLFKSYFKQISIKSNKSS